MWTAKLPQLRMVLSGDAHLCLRLQKGDNALEKLQSCLSLYGDADGRAKGTF